MRTLEKWLKNISKNKKVIQLFLSISYIGIVLWITVFSRQIGIRQPVEGLFWEFTNGYWRDIILNILLFVPIGIIVGKWKVVSLGFLLSASIEVIQYVFMLGKCEADDVLHNTLGTFIGVLICLMIRRFKLCIKNT